MAKNNKKLYRLLRHIIPIMLFALVITGVTYGLQDRKQIMNEFWGKYEKPEPPGEITISVRKVWEPAQVHPGSVKVQLFKNGAPQGEPVILDASNYWLHQWTKLSKDDVWTVDEINIPSGYIKTVTGNAAEGFVVTNKLYNEGMPPEPIEPEIDIPGTDVPGKGIEPNPETIITDIDIPKTGDEVNPRLWLIVLAVSTFILRYELFFRKVKINNINK